MPVEALVVGFYSLLSFYSLALNPIRLSQSDNRINCVESPKPLKANMHVGILYEPNFHLSTRCRLCAMSYFVPQTKL